MQAVLRLPCLIVAKRQVWGIEKTIALVLSVSEILGGVDLSHWTCVDNHAAQWPLQAVLSISSVVRVGSFLREIFRGILHVGWRDDDAGQKMVESNIASFV